MTDLFGVQEPDRFQAGELFEGPAGLRYALADLREKARAADLRARQRPRDRRLQARAAAAEREYLQLRDYSRGMSAEEIAAEARAEAAGERFRADYDGAGNCRVCGEAGRCPGWHSVPTDNAELFR